MTTRTYFYLKLSNYIVESYKEHIIAMGLTLTEVWSLYQQEREEYLNELDRRLEVSMWSEATRKQILPDQVLIALARYQ